MLQVSIQGNYSKKYMEIALKLKNLKKSTSKKGLKQAGKYMEASLKEGYQQSRDPQGRKWPKLKYAYRPDASGIAPFYNPRFRVTEKSKPLINTGQMINSIGSTLYGDSVIIGYTDRGRSEIARKHQFGLKGIYRYRSTRGGAVQSREMTPQVRKNIGFAWNWSRNRYTGANDLDAIVEIFRALIEDGIK